MRVHRLVLACALLTLWPVPSQAHMLGLRLDRSHTPPSASSPVGGSSGASLTGSYDLTEELSIDAGFGIARPVASPPTQGVPDKTSGGTVVNLSLGSSWFYGDHWFFMGAASLSPKSTSLDSTTVSMQDGKTTQDVPALIKADSASTGLLLSTSYATDGESNAETEVALTFGGTHLSTTQKLQDLGTVDLQKLKDFCKAGGKGSKVCKRNAALFNASTELLNMMSVGVLVTETLFGKTDVLLGGSYYLYDRDPNEVGYFTVATAGKGIKPGGNERGASFGTGIAIAPSLWASTLGVAHKFGDLRLTVIGGYGSYVDDGGNSRSVTLKAAYKINAVWRVLASASAQGDVDEAGAGTTSYSGSATVRCMF
jgi:hypothetical protein